MATLSRKQREIRERENLIVDVARGMLLERGYLGTTMDRIAQAAEYSKGTIYQHFSCKEEVLAAVAAETAGMRADFFERAAMFRGRPRERMIAIGEAEELFVRLYPQHFATEQIVHTLSIRAKISSERQLLLTRCDHRCMDVAAGIVRDGVAAGDLNLPPGNSPEELTFGLWTMSFGAHMILTMDIDLDAFGLHDPAAMLRQSCHRLLDGYGWAPLSTAWDYEDTYRRIRTEVFAEEARRAGLL